MEIIRKLFTSFKGSAKSVLLNYKEYIGIYIAIIIVQLLLGVWTMSAYTNYSSNNALFEENYKYDIIISDAKISLDDMRGVFRADKNMVTDFGMVGDSLGVSIKSGTLDRFKSTYLVKNNAKYTVTPYYAYHTDMQSTIILASVVIGAITVCVSALILSVIHSIRTNHYKFQYGIYMAFGADRKMLCKLVAQELFTINTLLLIPSAIVAYLLMFMIYVPHGVTVLFTPLQMLVYVILSYTVVSIASGSSIGGLFFKPPVSLISAADNSHFVTSPRRSINNFGKNIPFQYETYSIWRFRKYIIRLVSGAVAFSVIFVTAIYCANMIKAENNAPIGEYTFSFKSSTFVEAQREKANAEGREIIESLYTLPEVESVDFEQSKGFTYLSDHIILNGSNVPTGNTITIASSEKRDSGFTRAANNCRYVCINSFMLKNYERNYSVEYLDGVNADNLTLNPNLIVVSEGAYGVKNFSFTPGDKIILAEMTESGTIPLASDPMEVLNQQILNHKFKYTEYTIGAVIHNTDATSSIIIGVNEEKYQEVSRDKSAISEINIALKNGLELDEIATVHQKIDELMFSYDGWSVKCHDAAIDSYVDKKVDMPALLYLLSALVLVICPLIWVFSQTMFFRKREPEFRTLCYIGIEMKKILGIHLVSGALIFVLGFVVNFVFSRLACFGIYKLLTALLPRLGVLGVSVSFDSFVPIEIMLICAAVTALCGTVASIIPFLAYKAKLKKEAESVIRTDE